MSDILIKRNHMEIPWHNYVSTRNSQPITEASLSEKASLIGRTGMMLLSCGTGAWRVRSSMNTLSEALGITCSADIGLMSISYTCFDGESSFSHALSLTTTGVNTSRLNRLEHFVSDFPAEGIHMSGEALHSQLDEIERIHGLYSPAALGLASACLLYTSRQHLQKKLYPPRHITAVTCGWAALPADLLFLLPAASSSWVSSTQQ